MQVLQHNVILGRVCFPSHPKLAQFGLETQAKLTNGLSRPNSTNRHVKIWVKITFFLGSLPMSRVVKYGFLLYFPLIYIHNCGVLNLNFVSLILQL